VSGDLFTHRMNHCHSSTKGGHAHISALLDLMKDMDDLSLDSGAHMRSEGTAQVGS
jgi:hypothetical protein